MKLGNCMLQHMTMSRKLDPSAEGHLQTLAPVACPADAFDRGM